MSACAKSLTGLNGNRNNTLGKLGRCLACIIDNDTVVDVDRIKTIVLPSLVPILILHLRKIIGYSGAGQREVGKLSIELLFVEQFLLYITLDTILGIFKLIPSSVSSKDSKPASPAQSAKRSRAVCNKEGSETI